MREMSLVEARQCAFEILLWIDQFCSEKKISWWLCGGTLLGAIRHKGFIPWDDDIDIMLPRREYERLEAEFPKAGRYKFLTPENTNSFSYSYGKIYDTYTWKDERIRKKFQRVGIDIDVFPIDNLPSDYDECKSFYHEIERKGLALGSMKLVYGKGRTIVSTILKNSYIFYLRLLEWMGVITYEKTQKKFIELAQKYNNQECEYCGITCINHYGMKERNLKKGYQKTIMVEFEGHLFPAPECYDTYLSQLYGENYMQLPPVEKQVSHHAFKTYWK